MADQLDAHIGVRIRLRRTLLTTTLEELAAATDVSFQQMHKYETGVTRIPASRLYDLSQALGVPIGYFFEDIPAEALMQRSGGSIPRQQRPEHPLARTKCLKLVQAFSRLSPEQQDGLLDLALAIAHHR